MNWPLATGSTRSTEFETLLASLRDPLSGGAVVLGRHGIGKRTLVDEALREVASVPIMSLFCTPSMSSVPHGVLSPYLAELSQIDDSVAVLRELKRTVFNVVDLPKLQTVLVENAQYLDTQTCFVLSLLVENAAVKIIAIGNSSMERASPLDTLSQVAHLRTITVSPLDASGIRELAEKISGYRLSDGAIKLVLQASGGHPRLAKDFVSACVAQGKFFLDRTLLHAKGAHKPVWILANPYPEINAQLRTTAEDFCQDLESEERRALKLVALTGPLPTQVLDACSLPYRRLVDIGELSLSGTSLEFSSSFLAYLVRSTVSRQESENLNAIFRQALAKTGNKPDARQILWSLEIGETVDNSTVVHLAAKAMEKMDFALALRLCTLGRVAQHGAQAALLEAKVLMAMGRYRSARSLLRGLVEQLQDVALLGQAFGFLVEATTYINGASRENQLVLDAWGARIQEHYDAAELIKAMENQRSGTELLKLWKYVNSANGNLCKTEEILQFLASKPLPIQVRVLGMITLADSFSVAGRTQDALVQANSTMQILEQHPKTCAMYGVRLFFRIGWNLLFLGEHQQAHEMIAHHKRMHARAIKWYLGPMALLEGVDNLLQGRMQMALVKLAEAVTELRIRDTSQLLALSSNLYHLVARLQGIEGTASTEAESAGVVQNEVFEQNGYLDEEPFDQRVFVRAVAAALGQPFQGETLQDFPLVEREVLYRRICQVSDQEMVDSGMAQRFALLASVQQGSRAGLQAELVLLRSATDPAPLEDLAERALDRYEYSIAVEAQAHAAERHHQAGNQRRCGALLREASKIVDAQRIIPGKYTAHILALTELTAREAEIVELARSGMNNAQIAKFLTVSQRTVEGHLYRVFSKLGINERTEL